MVKQNNLILVSLSPKWEILDSTLQKLILILDKEPNQVDSW